MTLAFETLEPKDLLAGDVSVNVDGSTLEIVGDQHNNTIIVSPALPNIIHIRGVDTSVNGLQYILVDVASVDQMMASMGKGDDRIIMGSMSLDMDVDIDLGNGGGDPFLTDIIFFEDVHILGDLDIRGDDGDDRVMFFGSSAVNASIHLGSLEDSVQIRNSLFAGDLMVELGSGADRAHMYNTEVLGDATILGGQGQDQIFVRWAGFVHNDFLIDGGQGDQDRLVDLLMDGEPGNQDRLVVPSAGGDISAGGNIMIKNLELSGVIQFLDTPFFNRLPSTKVK